MISLQFYPCVCSISADSVVPVIYTLMIGMAAFFHIGSSRVIDMVENRKEPYPKPLRLSTTDITKRYSHIGSSRVIDMVENCQDASLTLNHLDFQHRTGQCHNEETLHVPA